MTSTAMTERRYWSGARALAYTGALVAWTILPAIAIGFTTSHLARSDPGTDWRAIGRVVALAVFSLGLLAGTWWAWRHYRRHVIATTGGAEGWQRRQRDKRLAVSGVWRDCLIVGFVVGIAGTFVRFVPEGAARLAMAAAVGLALAYAVMRGCLHYMRLIDEQERDANLWAGYAGLSTYAALFFAQGTAATFGVVVPHVHEAIFAIVITVTGGVYLWKRYR